MLDENLPIAARWALYALGAVEGQRIRRPRDPVAAWLLRRHPQLLPAFAAPSVLAMIRTRSAVIDRMIGCEAHWARCVGMDLHYHGLGGGFDARWYRLRRGLHDVVASHREVETPEVLKLKDRLLATSTFAPSWETVEQVQMDERAWQVPTERPGLHLVVLEGVADRVGAEGILRLLDRLRRESPSAHLVLDLPGFLERGARREDQGQVGRSRGRWVGATRTGAARIRTEQLTALGYRVVEDLWLCARPELRAASGMVICPGAEALRLLRLHPG